jgi:hypothetical protein
VLGGESAQSYPEAATAATSGPYPPVILLPAAYVSAGACFLHFM